MPHQKIRRLPDRPVGRPSRRGCGGGIAPVSPNGRVGPAQGRHLHPHARNAVGVPLVDLVRQQGQAARVGESQVAAGGRGELRVREPGQAVAPLHQRGEIGQRLAAANRKGDFHPARVIGGGQPRRAQGRGGRRPHLGAGVAGEKRDVIIGGRRQVGQHRRERDGVEVGIDSNHLRAFPRGGIGAAVLPPPVHGHYGLIVPIDALGQGGRNQRRGAVEQAGGDIGQRQVDGRRQRGVEHGRD